MDICADVAQAWLAVEDATIGTSSDDAQWGLEDVTEVLWKAALSRGLTNTREKITRRRQ